MVKTPTTSPRFLPASIVVSWGKNLTVIFNPLGHYPPPPPMYKPFKFLQATMAPLQQCILTLIHWALVREIAAMDGK